MGLLCARKCAGHRQSTGEPHALVQLGSKAFVKPPFQEVVQVRSNGYVQGLLDVAKYQRAGINLGNMPISRGLMQRRERESDRLPPIFFWYKREHEGGCFLDSPATQFGS